MDLCELYEEPAETFESVLIIENILFPALAENAKREDKAEGEDKEWPD